MHGSLRAPVQPASPVPAVLILAGSGPTDRNGDSTLIDGRVGTLKDLDDLLATWGIASLRYDKLNTGMTGLGPHTDLTKVGFDLYTKMASDGLAFLSRRPGIAPGRVTVIGHSEGALIALVLATKPSSRIHSLGLLMPLPMRYLDQLRQQVHEIAVLQGATEAQLAAVDESLDKAIHTIRTTGQALTGLDPGVQPLFQPQNARFLQQADSHAPVQLAARVPRQIPIFIACGTHDIQVRCADVTRLRDAASNRPDAVTEFVELNGVNHVLKEDTSKDEAEYGRPHPFSAQLRQTLSAFLQRTSR
ncbi:alpha/beta hydrolase [Streptomyces sp. NPDC052107]|uniref:alpha/beta hydrolase n=1 Tax=Streptomyces sp. NPDC052107 TaxID=3155632 RepID=UPI003432830D